MQASNSSRNQTRKRARAFGADDAVLRQQPAQFVDERGAAMDEAFAHSVNGLQVLLLERLDGHGS